MQPNMVVGKISDSRNGKRDVPFSGSNQTQEPGVLNAGSFTLELDSSSPDYNTFSQGQQVTVTIA